MYQYSELNDGEFEKLVIAICKEILGMDTQGFAKGADGGKDGEFHGTANAHPSIANPWVGTVIIQAKHTTGTEKHFTEPDFFGSDSSILTTEAIKVKNLYSDGKLDHYMIFANRRLTGNARPIIRNYLSLKTGLPLGSVSVLGIEDLDYYLDKYADIANMPSINLRPLEKAPTIDLHDLAEVISSLAQAFDDLEIQKLPKEQVVIHRTTFQEKNQLNNMSQELADSLERLYMQYVATIQKFLSDPQNYYIQAYYQDAIEEFQVKFVSQQQRELKYFDEIYNLLLDYLYNKNYILRVNKRLTKIMVFYMYWNCDIGKSNATPQ